MSFHDVVDARDTNEITYASIGLAISHSKIDNIHQWSFILGPCIHILLTVFSAITESLPGQNRTKATLKYRAELKLPGSKIYLLNIKNLKHGTSSLLPKIKLISKYNISTLPNSTSDNEYGSIFLDEPFNSRSNLRCSAFNFPWVCIVKVLNLCSVRNFFCYDNRYNGDLGINKI